MTRQNSIRRKQNNNKNTSLPSFPSLRQRGHSVGNDHGEPGLGPQGGASGPRGRVPEAKGRGTPPSPPRPPEGGAFGESEPAVANLSLDPPLSLSNTPNNQVT